jgi:hypothetical protein
METNSRRNFTLVSGLEFERIFSAQDSVSAAVAHVGRSARIHIYPNMPSETNIENKKKVEFQIFRGKSFVPWDDLLAQAAQLATEVGSERLITISHSADHHVGVVIVRYWRDAEETTHA